MILPARRFLLALLAALLAAPALAQAPQTTLDKIRKTGAITLGYIDGGRSPMELLDPSRAGASQSFEPG